MTSDRIEPPSDSFQRYIDASAALGQDPDAPNPLVRPQIEPPSITAPVDELHRRCLAERDTVRSHAHAIRCLIAEWEPKPMPEDWQ